MMSDLIEHLFARQPLRTIKGLSSSLIAYPIAEHFEKRNIRSKLRELRNHYNMPFEQRKEIAKERLFSIVEFSAAKVPYYQDLFRAKRFDPAKLRHDLRYLNDIPYLNKDIIREQGERLLSRPLESIRNYACKTGGSTGLSCVVYYDQEAVDYSAAVTLYARERIGKKKNLPELHFACRFPDVPKTRWPSREDFKCFAMNRSNIFFDRLDDEGLEEIWKKLKRRKPYLVHAHPSTIYALACYINNKPKCCKSFEIFESSGEFLDPYKREAIARNLQCKVIDRYGLAEFGVMAYELDGHESGLKVLESEGWAESIDVGEAQNGEKELVITGFRNKLMPLIRYRTGDLATVEENKNGLCLTHVLGRIHDLVPINGIIHATHHIQDMLDHRVGGIQEFQIDLRFTQPILKLVLETTANPEQIKEKVTRFWGNGFNLQFVSHDDFERVGRHAKFRHVVQT